MPCTFGTEVSSSKIDKIATTYSRSQAIITRAFTRYMRTIVAIDTCKRVISSKQVLFLFTARANFELIVSTSLRDQVSTGSCLLLDHLVVFRRGSDL